jgi:hypothetical protein
MAGSRCRMSFSAEKSQLHSLSAEANSQTGWFDIMIKTTNNSTAATLSGAAAKSFQNWDIENLC